MSTQPPAIEIRDLVVMRGGRRVIDGVSLDVPGGQITGLLGPSGSGKTTLMRAIVGVATSDLADLGSVADRARAVLAITAANEDARAFQRMAEANGVDSGSTPSSSAL